MSDLPSKEEQKARIAAFLEQHLSHFVAQAALDCFIWRGGRYQMRRACPSRLLNLGTWAAWQGFHIHNAGEGTIGGLMLADDATRKIWDEVSDMTIKIRNLKVSREV